MKKVLSDLAKYLKVKGLRGLAHYYEVPESRIYSWTKKGRIANPALLLTKNPELNEDWIKTGKGPMLAGKVLAKKRRAKEVQTVEPAPAATEVAESCPPTANLSTLLAQVAVLAEAGGETRAMLELQVKTMIRSLEKDRELQMVLKELSQLRGAMETLSAALLARNSEAACCEKKDNPEFL